MHADSVRLTAREIRAMLKRLDEESRHLGQRPSRVLEVDFADGSRLVIRRDRDWALPRSAKSWRGVRAFRVRPIVNDQQAAA